MLDNQTFLHQSISGDDHLQLRRHATQAFKRNHFWAQFFAFLRKLFLQATHLEPLHDNNNRAGNGRHLTKLQFVPIEDIEGSEGRSRDFDAQFRPLRKHIQERWINIAIARTKGVQLPPVDLIQIGEKYFVRDGHHRISVARAQGQVVIDAMVTVW